MNEQLDVYVRVTFNLPAELPIGQQEDIIRLRVNQAFQGVDDTFDHKILRIEPEFQVYSNPVRDAFDQPIRVGDTLWWNNMEVEVLRLHEGSGRVSVKRPDRRRPSVIHAWRTVRKP